MELLGASLCIIIRHCTQKFFPLWTDSTYVINNIVKSRTAYRDNRYQSIQQALRRLLHHQPKNINHIRGHPERRIKKHLWSKHDHGIYAADQIAGNHAISPGQTTIEVPASEIIAYLQQHMGYHITDASGPILHSNAETIAAKEQRDYQNDRVHKYNSEYDWTSTTTEFAAKIWGLAASDLPTAATSVRIIYDKMWHGRNQGKSKQQVYKCPLCDQDDSQEHLFFHCNNEDI